jgi:methionyl-tRNA synthetase
MQYLMLGLRLGNKLLQDNKLDNRLHSEEPERCAAVIGVTLNLLNLLAGVIFPYMPDTAKSIFHQLGKEPNPYIPDKWDKNALKPGHKIGEPKLLFSIIPASKIEEWREAYGGEEVRRQKQLAAEKAAAKKAAKEKEKEKKKAKKSAAAAQASGGPGVEAPEKHQEADPSIEKVTEAVGKAELRTS